MICFLFFFLKTSSLCKQNCKTKGHDTISSWLLYASVEVRKMCDVEGELQQEKFVLSPPLALGSIMRSIPKLGEYTLYYVGNCIPCTHILLVYDKKKSFISFSITGYRVAQFKYEAQTLLIFEEKLN